MKERTFLYNQFDGVTEMVNKKKIPREPCKCNNTKSYWHSDHYICAKCGGTKKHN